MKRFKYLLVSVFFAIMLASTVNCFCSHNDMEYGNLLNFNLDNRKTIQSKMSQEVEGKFYVDPEAIYISHEGLFLNIDGELFPISFIASDELGIYIPYIMAYKERCRYGHSIKCNRCNGCSDRRDCPYRCRCYH